MKKIKAIRSEVEREPVVVYNFLFGIKIKYSFKK